MRLAQRQPHLTFAERLRDLGYTCYEHYLRSEHWLDFRLRYLRSSMPQECLGCQKQPIELHHRTYDRLGCEQFQDVVPLCHDCHHKLHIYEKQHKLGVHATAKILQAIHGWTDLQRKERFRPFNSTFRTETVPQVSRLSNPERDARRLLKKSQKPQSPPYLPSKGKKAIKREAASYAYDVLHAVYAANPPRDHHVMMAFLDLLHEIEKRGRK